MNKYVTTFNLGSTTATSNEFDASNDASAIAAFRKAYQEMARSIVIQSATLKSGGRKVQTLGRSKE